MPIYIGETADSLNGAYARPEAKVIGEDKKVPEFRAPVACCYDYRSSPAGHR